MKAFAWVTMLGLCVFIGGYAVGTSNWLGVFGAAITFVIWVTAIRPKDL